MTKPCYGNYMKRECEGHHECREMGCFSETSRIHGECDCKYKESCHLTRQKLQVHVRNDNSYGYDSVEKCDFYKLIDRKMGDVTYGRGEKLLCSISGI